jgi:phosphoribosylformylglycinamidine cyclo-ligase
MVRGVKPGSGFDIVGTAVGLVPLDRIIVGDELVDGDVVIGLASSGIHSNGLSLARKALFEAAGHAPDQYLDDLGRSVGEELLEPTRIYVRPVLALLDQVEEVKALAHITGDGLLNLLRVKSSVGFQITDLPEPQKVFQLIQAAARVEDSEMFRVFNMGIGFAIVVGAGSADRALQALHDSGAADARIIGSVTSDQPGKLTIPARGLTGTRREGFVRSG